VDGVVLRFDATSEMRSELDEFIAFERGCCPTLGFSVHESSRGLDLEILGVDPDSELFDGFSSQPETSSHATRRWCRALSSVGLGTVGALTICCVLPMAALALFGAAIAAPLTSLDHPWVISSMALGLAAVLWLWQKRRAARHDELASAPACSARGDCGC
jgi:hypothetical protein